MQLIYNIKKNLGRYIKYLTLSYEYDNLKMSTACLQKFVIKDVDYLKEMYLAPVESRFADIIWANEPLAMRELVQLCKEQLGWKRTTTYTVLKRLADRGLFCNQSGIVTALISRDNFYAIKSEKFVNDEFNGSLPAFLAAFTSNKTLSEEDIYEIKKLIDEYGDRQ